MCWSQIFFLSYCLGFRVPGLVLSLDVQFFSVCQGVNVVCSEAFLTSQVRNSSF